MVRREIRTNIVCTIGPVSRPREVRTKTIRMNTARLTVTRSDCGEHATTIADTCSR